MQMIRLGWGSDYSSTSIDGNRSLNSKRRAAKGKAKADVVVESPERLFQKRVPTAPGHSQSNRKSRFIDAII